MADNSVTEKPRVDVNPGPAAVRALDQRGAGKQQIGSKEERQRWNPAPHTDMTVSSLWLSRHCRRVIIAYNLLQDAETGPFPVLPIRKLRNRLRQRIPRCSCGAPYANSPLPSPPNGGGTKAIGKR